MENYIKEILENSGWYTERQIDVNDMIEELQEAGFETISSHILNLLKEFGNLNIEFQTPDGKFSNIRLNIEALYQIDKRILDKISTQIHDNIIPVGSIHEDSALLLTSNSGAFYMVAEGKVYKVGNDFLEALNTIIYQKDVTKYF